MCQKRNYFDSSLNSAAAYQQQDNRYPNAYVQPDYNATQYGTSSDYNSTPSSDYTQTGAYDNRSYSGYGEYALNRQFLAVNHTDNGLES